MKSQLLRMLEDLAKYKEDKHILELRYVQERLDTSLNNYCFDLAKSTTYLTNHISHKNIRKINK